AQGFERGRKLPAEHRDIEAELAQRADPGGAVEQANFADAERQGAFQARQRSDVNDEIGGKAFRVYVTGRRFPNGLSVFTYRLRDRPQRGVIHARSPGRTVELSPALACVSRRPFATW